MTNKCDLCGSTTIDHNELTCSMNRVSNQVSGKKINEKTIRANERALVIAEIESWLVDERPIIRGGYAKDENGKPIMGTLSLDRAGFNSIVDRNKLRAELRTKVQEMKL